jgi:hypothetical protein
MLERSYYGLLKCSVVLFHSVIFRNGPLEKSRGGGEFLTVMDFDGSLDVHDFSFVL